LAEELGRERAENDRLAAAIRHVEARYTTLTEHAHDLICEFDTRGRLMYITPNSREVLGYEQHELMDRDLSALVHPEDLQQVVRAFSDLATGATVEASYRLRTKSGEWFWLESRGTPFKTSSGEVRIIVVGRDITDRRRDEQERLELASRIEQGQRLESLGVLTGGSRTTSTTCSSRFWETPISPLPRSLPARTPMGT